MRLWGSVAQMTFNFVKDLQQIINKGTVYCYGKVADWSCLNLLD